MKKNALKFSVVSAALAVILFVSCSKNENKDTSTLQIQLTDGPTYLQEVNVDIREVKVKFSDDTSNTNGWVTMQTYAGQGYTICLDYKMA